MKKKSFIFEVILVNELINNIMYIVLEGPKNDDLNVIFKTIVLISPRIDF